MIMKKIYGRYRIYGSMKIGRVSLVCRSGATIAGIIWTGGDSIVRGHAPRSVGKLTWIKAVEGWMQDVL